MVGTGVKDLTSQCHGEDYSVVVQSCINLSDVLKKLLPLSSESRDMTSCLLQIYLCFSEEYHNVNAWKVLKCGAGEGWRRSVGPIM